MPKHKSYNKIPFRIRVRKRFAQRFIYMFSKVRGNTTMLCGPATLQHYLDYKLVSTSKSKCFIYELDKATYLKNKRDIKKYSLHHMVAINKDILKAKITRLMDLDFCKTLNSTKHIVKTIFGKMKLIHSKFSKHLIVTFSSRGSIITDDITTLCNIIDIPPTFKKDRDIKGMIKYIHTNPEIDVFYIVYRDGMLMTTFSYQWK